MLHGLFFFYPSKCLCIPLHYTHPLICLALSCSAIGPFNTLLPVPLSILSTSPSKREASHLKEQRTLLGILVGQVKEVLLEVVIGQEVVGLPPVLAGPHLLCLLQVPFKEHSCPVTLAQPTVQPDGESNFHLQPSS